MVDKQKDGTARTSDADTRRLYWLEENALAFAAQAEWHERHPHPLSEILVQPGKYT